MSLQLLKKIKKALAQLTTARRFRARVCISCVTYYETKRGTIHSGASQQLSRFEDLCSVVEILLIDDLEIIETASRIHADLRRKGRPIQDVDILIAASAMFHSLTLISNDSDVQNIESLSLDNWL